MKRLAWAREVAVLVLVYVGYSLVRSALDGSEQLAELNADRVMRLEHQLGLAHEKSIQQFLDEPAIIRPLNTFYALSHFLVTGGVMLWLFLRRPSYGRWRNVIMATTFLALVGYALFPLMPPRLYEPDGVVDTLALYGAPWTYSGDSIGNLTNQYAAMPSLHVAWAMWCTWALWREAQRRWARVAAVTYSILAVIAVVATGNHYLLDVVGAVIVLWAGAAASRRIAPLLRRLRRRFVGRRHEAATEPTGTTGTRTRHDIHTAR